MDTNGNAMVDVIAMVTTLADENDTTIPEVSSIDFEHNHIPAIRFDDKVVATAGTAKVIATPETGIPITLTMAGVAINDRYFIVFVNSVANYIDEETYTITSEKGVKDKHNNSYVVPSDEDDKDTFDSTTDPKPGSGSSFMGTA